MAILGQLKTHYHVPKHDYDLKLVLGGFFNRVQHYSQIQWLRAMPDGLVIEFSSQVRHAGPLQSH